MKLKTKRVKAWALVYSDGYWRTMRTRKSARYIARSIIKESRPKVVPVTIVFEEPPK